jgi:hypothetical protein
MMSINDIEKKRGRGRPPTDATPVLVRVPADTLQGLDAWITTQNESDLSRPEAIRRLIELGLTVKPKARPGAQNQKDRARELAAKAIDGMTDATATEDDKAGRKRRLIKGPEEFRDARVDRPKAKRR